MTVVVKTVRAVAAVAVAAARVRPLFTILVSRENLLVGNFFITIYRQPSIQTKFGYQQTSNQNSKDHRMDFLSLLQYTFGKVVETFSHNWWLLLISILISAALKLYVDQDAIADFLRRNTKNNVLISTGIAVATPFCSCGTTAIVLGMMASTIPWAPIVAFMVASPLTSPQELFYSAGLFGWPFAIAFFLSSILLGLMGGAIANFAELRG